MFCTLFLLMAVRLKRNMKNLYSLALLYREKIKLNVALRLTENVANFVY